MKHLEELEKELKELLQRYQYVSDKYDKGIVWKEEFTFIDYIEVKDVYYGWDKYVSRDQHDISKLLLERKILQAYDIVDWRKQQLLKIKKLEKLGFFRPDIVWNAYELGSPPNDYELEWLSKQEGDDE